MISMQNFLSFSVNFELWLEYMQKFFSILFLNFAYSEFQDYCK